MDSKEKQELDRLMLVCNLDIEKVTWARSFIRAARSLDISVENSIMKDIRLFLGDNIEQEDNGRTNLYYLASFSTYPGEIDSELCRAREIQNIFWADLTIVPSVSEEEKVKAFITRPKIVPAGFPIVFPTSDIKAKDRSICFIADDRDVKNIQFEIELVGVFSRQGYQCCHLSPTINKYRKELERQGCKVFEARRGQEYWDLIAENSYYISTSHYESLSVSGIEATILGCIPITPDVGGFKDWCPNRYESYDTDSVLERLRVSRACTITELSKYRPENFFRKILEAIK